MCGGQSGVAAQIDLDGGGKPAQRPVSVNVAGQRVSEGGLGQIHFGGDLLHPGHVGPRIVIEQADGCEIACEWAGR